MLDKRLLELTNIMYIKHAYTARDLQPFTLYRLRIKRLSFDQERIKSAQLIKTNT